MFLGLNLGKQKVSTLIEVNVTITITITKFWVIVSHSGS